MAKLIRKHPIEQYWITLLALEKEEKQGEKTDAFLLPTQWASSLLPSGQISFGTKGLEEIQIIEELRENKYCILIQN